MSEQHNDEPIVLIAGRQTGKASALIDSILDRANERGVRVQVVPATSREELGRAVGSVLFDVSNYPKEAQSRLWGRDIGPLREKVTDAVLAAMQRGVSR
ncbi:hypothetical protein [Curtobacterium sp. BRD11]|uniref:hypothetical protein n=1 Tax=Curtobacterium sp. BRD11 TaxID=2962581 RepID=UPI002881A0D5|nr:hypothetical protein [Curtobacterium sp. BRD11]MDT0211228.1 hypothetical protein [Curtobacterium sp. BRD11]